MKSIKTFVAVIALAASFGSFAAQAQEAGASSYKITQAFTGNRVHMTAELNK